MKGIPILAIALLAGCAAITDQAPDKVAAECAAYMAVKAVTCATPGLLPAEAQAACAVNVLCPLTPAASAPKAP